MTQHDLDGRVEAVCVAVQKGHPKHAVAAGTLIADHGVLGDAHAGLGPRQVSLLAGERIDEMRQQGLDLPHGAFGENLVTRGIDLDALPVGCLLQVGAAVIQITRRGKTCHTRCRIYHEIGDCIMPRAGLFARVVRSGDVLPGCLVALSSDAGTHAAGESTEESTPGTAAAVGGD